MVSSPGDRTQPSSTAPNGKHSVSSKSQHQRALQIDTEQVFRLIDSILPFEACLYHQVIPLCLEGSRLKLGMVNLDDTAALDYVRRILAYMNCSLVPQAITSETHHSLLSSYLSHTGKSKQAAQSATSAATPTPTSSTGHNDAGTRDRSQKSAKVDQNAQPTLIVDSPEALNFLEADSNDSPAHPTPPPILTSTPTDVSAPTEPPTLLTEDDDPPTSQPNEVPGEFLSSALSPSAEVVPPPAIPLSADALPTLEVDAKYLSSPVEVLATLAPRQLLHELLGRVLVGGIGRLYFERQPHHGRILWSQNGVLQSVLDQLPTDTFQGVINELKLLTHLPLIATTKPKQVEIERLYQQSRLLLRLRVMPGTHGEEATLQVLRGAALKFYQQQQLANLSRDALGIAQQLQLKVHEIRNRTRFNPMLTAEHLDLLPALNKVLKSVDEQLAALKALPISGQVDDED